MLVGLAMAGSQYSLFLGFGKLNVVNGARGLQVSRFIHEIVIHTNSELSAHPTSGGPYFWAAMLSPKEDAAFSSWITGMALLIRLKRFYCLNLQVGLICWDKSL